MAALHQALECLRPKDFGDIPTDDLKPFLSTIFNNAELIANSVPPPPNGTPYEYAQRTRTSSEPASNAADLTTSEVRRPPPAKEHEELRKAWGKPLKLGNKDAATGMSVFKMAGHDRHGAWFARTGVHEGLGFAKWKRAMLREFPESLEVQGGPGVGNVRGIGGDQRLEDITVDGVGKLEVYQLSAQFPGPTSPREFITLLLTSDTCLTEASNVGDAIPRHFMVVSIPVTHPEAPARPGMVLGAYESIEMIREIPMTSSTETGEDAAETNPVEWIMVTRSDPGGGIPRFMVERSVPSSIVQDAIKFLDWACAKLEPVEAESMSGHDGTLEPSTTHDTSRNLSVIESNGITAGIGTSIADRPSLALRRLSQRTVDKSTESEGTLLGQLKDSVASYLPDALNPVQRTISSSSSSTSSSVESFASAEQFNTASDGFSSSPSQQSLPVVPDDSPHAREMQKIEEKKRQLQERLDQAREKQTQELQNESQKTQKEMEKAAEKHSKERKRQEDKFQKEIRKLEERREKETKKLLARQQRDANKNQLQKAQRERDEHKQRVDILEQENKLLKDQIGDLQRENTALVARMGKTEVGREILRQVREEDLKGRTRASSRASGSSGKSGKSGKKSKDFSELSVLAKSVTEVTSS